MFEILSITSTITIGLFAGSLLTEGAILVPYWRRMDPSEFFRLHGTLGPRLFQYFAPLTTLTVGLGISVAVVDQGRTIVWVGAALICALTLAIFFVYFKKANASFADGSLSEDALASELARWNAWHWLRTILIIFAFVLSVFGHTG